MNGREQLDNKRYQSCQYRLQFLPKYVEEWFTHLRATGKTASTCDIMLGKVSSFLSFVNSNGYFIREVEPKQITADVVERYLVDIKEKVKDGKIVKTSNAHQQATWSCLKNFLDFMSKRGYISENYIVTQDIKCTNKKDVVDRPYLTGEDFKKIIETTSFKKEWDDIRNRDVAILMVFMNTGIRLSALCSIDIEDIDFEMGFLSVMEKGEKIRKCKLNPKTLEALQDWIKVRPYKLKSEWESALFVSTHGFRINPTSCREAIKKRCKEAGYELTPHMLRGGYITILQEKTGDINFVCDAVGHSSINTTKRYVRNNGKQSEMAADIIAKAIDF